GMSLLPCVAVFCAEQRAQPPGRPRDLSPLQAPSAGPVGCSAGFDGDHSGSLTIPIHYSTTQFAGHLLVTNGLLDGTCGAVRTRPFRIILALGTHLDQLGEVRNGRVVLPPGRVHTPPVEAGQSAFRPRPQGVPEGNGPADLSASQVGEPASVAFDCC